MDEPANRRLLVEAMGAREGERIDPVQRPVGRGFNRRLQRIGDGGLRRLPQQIPERGCFSHRTTPNL